MEQLAHDLRYAFRQLRREPRFMGFVVLTLAIGIGANTTIFGVVNAMLLRPLPYHEADRLVSISGAYEGRGDNWSVSLPNALDWGRRSRSFESTAYFQQGSVILAAGERPERLRTTRGSASLLSLLNAQPLLGRSYTAEEDHAGAERVVLLSHELWQRSFGGSQDVLGQTVSLSGYPHTIIGVLRPGFSFPVRGVDLYTPVRRDESDWTRASGGLQVIGRLADGVTIEQARDDLDAVSMQLATEHPDTNAELTAHVSTLREALLGGGPTRLILFTLLGAVVFVLLIACVNVANLLLARASLREHEVAVRAAIGAGRSRVVRQLLTESMLLAFIGGALGVLFSFWGSSMIAGVIPADAGLPADFGIDARVLAFTLSVTVVTGLLFGAAPALHAARTDLTTLIGTRAGGSTARRRGRRRNMLVIGEVALATVLLAGAGLMIRSLGDLMSRDPGFQSENLLTFRVSFDARYDSASKTVGFMSDVNRRLASLPGVRGAGAVDWVPLGGTNNFNDIHIVDGPAEPQSVGTVMVSAGYIEAMGIPLQRGRAIAERDVRAAPGVVVVNRAFADQYWPDTNPIGKRIAIPWDRDGDQPYEREVIGVVGNVRHGGLDEGHRTEIYIPFAQVNWASGSATFVVRTQTDPVTMIDAARNAVWDVDRSLAVHDIQTMNQLIDQSGAVIVARVMAGTLGSFGAIALLLAALGLYGVISYGVVQRTYEIGLRSALGAQAKDIVTMIMRQGLAMVAIGLVVGVAAALVLGRVLTSVLYGVTATDPLTFAGVVLLLLGVAAAATAIPARHALHIEPTIALKAE